MNGITFTALENTWALNSFISMTLEIKNPMLTRNEIANTHIVKY